MIGLWLKAEDQYGGHIPEDVYKKMYKIFSDQGTINGTSDGDNGDNGDNDDDNDDDENEEYRKKFITV